MKTIISTLIAVIALVPATLFAQNNGRIKVTVLDENNSTMPGVVVSIIAGGPVANGITDLDGIFTFVDLNPGSYDVQARMTGYKRYVKTGIQVTAGQTAYIQCEMSMGDTLKPVVIKAV